MAGTANFLFLVYVSREKNKFGCCLDAQGTSIGLTRFFRNRVEHTLLHRNAIGLDHKTICTGINPEVPPSLIAVFSLSLSLSLSLSS